NKNVEPDDLISLLAATGYELFSYDITEMLNERYDIVFVRKEFEAGKEIQTSNLSATRNKTLMTDFPESEWQKIIDEGMIIDEKNRAIALAEKITFGFYPSGNDSTRIMQIRVPGFMSMGRVSFKLKGLAKKNSDELLFFYHTRPFKMKTFKDDEFIPLILLGSGWYDERFDVFRFCGEREIEPDMSSEILKDVPHYYVIGVKFIKKQ
ncbi:MAG: DUF5041 domain-containing protein, partial [Tannerella sp.]|nr:DUF5041 domain-containing protein [Tannerella sp.]